MEAVILQFRPRETSEAPKTEPPPESESESKSEEEITRETVELLSQQILNWGLDHHDAGVSGLDIYRGIVMALCKLIAHADPDPIVVSRRIEAAREHLLEVYALLVAEGHLPPVPANGV